MATESTSCAFRVNVSIIVKILEYYGAIEIIGENLGPAMGVVGLPGEFGLVFATAMIANIYGALIVFFTLSLQYTYTVAQVTILACMMLIAHTLPVEGRIAQKAGVRLWYTLSLRILGALGTRLYRSKPDTMGIRSNWILSNDFLDNS